MSVLFALPFLLIGYLVGSIPTGVLVARARGVDLQRTGSGNIGATNVLRAIGPRSAAFVVLMDPIKGAAATFFPIAMGMDAWTVGATAVATALGNNFNVFLGMRGGKGIATSLGAFLVIAPQATL
ncbi:MAG: glycerol-3-phosphate acyltransferase, partial [Trueperaceae bacterium]